MKNIIIILFVICALSACESAQYDLERSINVPDDVFSELPAYSEWGYNTFGAFYERKLFIYTNSEVPAKVIYTDNLARLIFKGALSEPSDYGNYYSGYYYTGQPMTLIIDLPEFKPDTYTDLVELNDMTYNLADPGLNVTVIMTLDTIDMDIFNGKLWIKRAQQLIVDQEPAGVILSGVFGFQALVDGSPISMSNGRFDVNIDEYDFAKY
jgi:hypothetical protein